MNLESICGCDGLAGDAVAMAPEANGPAVFPRSSTPAPALVPASPLSGRAAFVTTHWTAVVSARDQDSPQALEEICQSYWYPLYVYVRRKGYEVADAQDLIQGFLAQFLEKHYLGSVDERKGRFRSFLLASLEHFLAKEWTRAHRLKRGGGHVLLSWDAQDPEARRRLEPEDQLTAERLYERHWALTVLAEALRRLGAEYAAAGKAGLFEVLQPLLSEPDEEISYPQLAADLDMSQGAVRVAVHRLRQRYGEAVRAEIGRMVQHPGEIEDELRHLFTVLS